MKGNYISNNWNNNTIKVDFYLIKGIIENLLDYLGFKNRYSFNKNAIPDLHPGVCAEILLDRERIGIVGRVHPSLQKDEIYVAEISLNKLMKSIKPIKFKPASKYPEVVKDLAFIVDKNTTAQDLMNQIKKSGGRLLTDIDVFDVYMGENIGENKKSIAFTLTFSDPTRTLNDTEVTDIFDKIIKEVQEKCNAKIRDN